MFSRAHLAERLLSASPYITQGILSYGMQWWGISMSSKKETTHEDVSKGTTVRSFLRARSRWVLAAALIIAVAAVGVVASVHGRASAGTTGTCQPKSVAPPAKSAADSYDSRALSLDPVAYLTMGNPASGAESDLSGNGHNGTYSPASSHPGVTKLPNGDPAASFNGTNQYLQVPSSSALSVPQTGCLSVQAWIQPGTLQFSHQEGTGYVYTMGKGTTGSYEYAMRMYSKTNTESPVRPNRISGYAWNLSGGLGSGEYFQKPVTVNQWIMVTIIIDANASSKFPSGYVSIYRNGTSAGQVSLSQYNTKPKAGSAPFRVGTRDLESFFQGGVGKVAIYNYVLSGADISAAYGAM
jgi:hypothetical protein